MSHSKLIAAAICAATLFASCNNTSTPAADQHAAEKPAGHAAIHAETPEQALAELKAGNKRYVDGRLEHTDYKDQRDSSVADQHPHSFILSCIDSRVPPETIFDQGIGQIFVGRVAGNIEETYLLGSMEYATKVKGSKLVVVLGHSKCGAVKGAIDNVELGNLTQLVAHIKPAITGDTTNREAMVDATIKNNVKLTIAHIMEKSPEVAALVKAGTVKIVGAYYDLATGVVTFME